MSIKQTIKVKTFTGSGSIDFEEDRKESLGEVNNAKALSDQVTKLQSLEDEIDEQEKKLKELKRNQELLSGEVIPTMMTEMNISTLKLADGSAVEVKPVYGASIPAAKKEDAFNWLRENGLGDLIKNEITVAFGRNEDNKAQQYAVLAQGQGYEPVQKLKVEPMTLKALVRERLESGQEMPSDLFNVAQKKSAQLPANIFEEDAAKGLGKLGQEDLALPFLKILGQLSPEVNKRDGKYVEGAEPGMIFNSVSGELYDGMKGITVVPCFYKLEYIEWKDRGEGSGGPVQIHDSSSDIMSQTKADANYKDRLPNGNYVEKTASHFVLITNPTAATALISMKSTQLKISRKWNSMMAGIKMKGKNGMFTPASFSHEYKLKTVQMSNDKGTWFGWEVQKIGPVANAELYQQAKAFAESISKGDVKAKHGETDKKDSSHF